MMIESAVSQWIQTHGETLQVGGFFALFAALALLERAFPRRSDAPERRARWRANLGLTSLNLVVFMVLPVSFIGAAHWAHGRELGLLHLVALPLPVLLLANLLLRGLISFVTHRLMHAVPLFWRVHRVHHLDTEIDVSSTVRFHPLEFLIGPIIGIPLVVLFGFTPWMLVLYEVLDVAVTLLSHSNVRVPLAVDRFLRYLVVTPDLHRIHHSTWQPETDSNFSAVFPVWDLVFGTFRGTPRQPHETMPLGLEEARGRQTNEILWLLSSPRRAGVGDDGRQQSSPPTVELGANPTEARS